MILAGRPRRYPTRSVTRGFTLVELAVVVLVVGLLIGSLLVPLSTQVDQRNITEAQRRLEDARDALLGYVIANGRFPCPASSSSNGQESFCTTAGISTSTCTQTLTPPSDMRCSNFSNGYLPGTVLGLNNLDSSGYALDGYPLSAVGQGRIRYAIADPTYSGKLHGLTNVSGTIRAAGINILGSGAGYLSLCTVAPGLPSGTCAAANFLSNANVVFVVYSLGKNGTSGTSTDEAWNINTISTAKALVSRPYSSGSTTDFDDQLVWISNYTLISRLIAAGMLP